MKLLFMSDIHGSAYYMSKMLDAIEFEKPNQIILLGDALYHGPRNPLPIEYDPKKVVDMLNSLKTKIIAVRGNCDSEVDQMLIEYPMLSDYGILFEGGRRIIITHGHLYNKDTKLHLQKGDIYVQGHTHVPQMELIDGVYYLNPGSISLPKNNTKCSYGILENNQFLLKTLECKLLEKVELLNE